MTSRCLPAAECPIGNPCCVAVIPPPIHRSSCGIIAASRRDVEWEVAMLSVDANSSPHDAVRSLQAAPLHEGLVVDEMAFEVDPKSGGANWFWTF
ncbi:hypothetical protein GCM10009106_22640 [Sphingomonas japonica]